MTESGAIALQWAEIAVGLLVPVVGFLVHLLLRAMRRVSDLDVAVGVLQSRLDAIPTSEALNSLSVQIASLSGVVDSCSKLIGAHAAQLRRIEDHLLGVKK